MKPVSPSPATREPHANELRDHLANERTFLAWVRTGMAIVALGFVVAKFGILLREVGGTHVHAMTAKAGGVVGVALVVAGILSIALATQRFDMTRRDIDNGVVRFSPWLDLALAVMVVVVSLVLAIYLVATA